MIKGQEERKSAFVHYVYLHIVFTENLESLFLGFVRVASLSYFLTCLPNKNTEDFPKEILKKKVRNIILELSLNLLCLA